MGLLYVLALPLAALVYGAKAIWITGRWTWVAMVATGRASRAVWRWSVIAAGQIIDALYHYRHRNDPQPQPQPTAGDDFDMPTEAKIRFHLEDEDGVLTRMMTTPHRSTP